jgi:hypothetical protein
MAGRTVARAGDPARRSFDYGEAVTEVAERRAAATGIVLLPSPGCGQCGLEVDHTWSVVPTLAERLGRDL